MVSSMACCCPPSGRSPTGDETALKKVDLGGQILTIMLLVMLYLMVFKPGL